MRNIHSAIYYLKNREYLTPNYIRLTLENDNLEAIRNSTLGVNNKIFIAPKAIEKVHIPEFDFEKMEWTPMPEHLKPHVRTYTHRGINFEKNEIYLEFVAHGDEGPASDFAIHAPIGSELGISMHAEPKSLYPEVEDYLLVGDATAIPVLACILESLPENAKVHVIIEVISAEDVQKITTKAQATFEWLINPTPGQNSFLAARTKLYVDDMNPNSRFAYVAAEFSSVKEIRNYLRKEKQWTKDELDAYSYWKFGKSETGSENERRAELAEKEM
ncbi:siderophore-interacting protein [Soonwooa sp.]|uniref:siderophore-interacting protein n=1 Tax=Soonwooa sp. TaxID=1938592 RepID=UPI002608315E|nr:siderophore-interacting protein [Soonwooa sp.]